MSQINGEKARAMIAKSNRNAQRVKDRMRLAEIRKNNAAAPAATTDSK